MPGEILPEYVVFRVALWQFDKGGILQDLLHLLKYEHLYDLGIDFGRQTGRIVRKRAASCGLEFCYQPLLVPVPLHKSQKRRRGYNQARAIAEGVAEMTGWAILGEGCVRRTSNTRTQTGLATGRRRSNVSGAFTADSVRFLPVELPVIIDDVYTTGATVMELALTLRKAGAQKIGIATLAEA